MKEDNLGLNYTKGNYYCVGQGIILFLSFFGTKNFQGQIKGSV